MRGLFFSHFCANAPSLFGINRERPIQLNTIPIAQQGTVRARAIENTDVQCVYHRCAEDRFQSCSFNRVTRGSTNRHVDLNLRGPLTDAAPDHRYAQLRCHSLRLAVDTMLVSVETGLT